MEPEPVTPEATLNFLQQLGERWPFEASVYLIGGGALALLGNPRQTQDLDYTADVPAEQLQQFRSTVDKLAAEMRLDLEEAPILERLFELILPKSPKFDIDRREFRRYFEEVRRRRKEE